MLRKPNKNYNNTALMKIKNIFMFQAKETFLRLIPLHITQISENSMLQKYTTLITRLKIIIVLKNDQN